MKPNNLVLTQSHTTAKHHKSKLAQNPPWCLPIKETHLVSCIMHLVGRREIFNTAEQYSWEMRGSYHTMGVWQFIFIGFNMTHCLLTKTEHQQEIDSKNKDQAPSAFPHILYILPWYWHSRRGVVHKEPIRTLPQSGKESESFVWATWRAAGWACWRTHRRFLV